MHLALRHWAFEEALDEVYFVQEQLSFGHLDWGLRLEALVRRQVACVAAAGVLRWVIQEESE